MSPGGKDMGSVLGLVGAAGGGARSGGGACMSATDSAESLTSEDGKVQVTHRD